MTTRFLKCCCCGAATQGAQWWNRDNGFGLCPSCVVYIKARKDYRPEDFRDLYGVEGINYNVTG